MKNFFGSIRFKIELLLMVIVVINCLIMIMVYTPRIKNNVTDINSNYIQDLAISYGTMIDNELNDGKDALSADNLKKELEGVGLEGVESSYAYVVDSTGIMLYHPTASKIGNLVENEAVTNTVKQISEGKDVKNEVVSYLFRGETKYAGIYVNDDQTFILVVSADQSEIFKPVDNINKAGYIGMIVAIILALVAGIIVSSYIVKPIKKITSLTTKVASMDLTESDENDKLSKRSDETGGMGRALADLRNDLSNVVNNIRDKSSNLKSSSNALSSDAKATENTMMQVEKAVNDIASGASSQAEETQKATENVILMGNMIEETNSEVNNLLSFANDMKDSTNDAKAVLSQLSEINQSAEASIDMIAKQTVNTNESAMKISDATKLITSIAEETNLLSLNASIEAARAGEQGRGFAVVAAEIQKLAEQSNESAKKIEEIIQVLLEDSEKAVETMYDVKEIFRTQSDQVEQTETAFELITDGVKQSIDGINRISKKTAQLDEARVEVVDVVQNLTAIAEENAAGSEETSASVTEVSTIIEDIAEKSLGLEQIAKELEESINVFKF